MDDVCTHRGGPLSEGILADAEVTCPWHGAVFDVTTGEVISPPAPHGIAIYPVMSENTIFFRLQTWPEPDVTQRYVARSDLCNVGLTCPE